ncbi:unnamed protein product, partial [Iphiclides podalirius]
MNRSINRSVDIYSASYERSDESTGDGFTQREAEETGHMEPPFPALRWRRSATMTASRSYVTSAPAAAAAMIHRRAVRLAFLPRPHSVGENALKRLRVVAGPKPTVITPCVRIMRAVPDKRYEPTDLIGDS